MRHYERLVTDGEEILGLSVAALGPFFEADSPVNGDNINGWPLFSERQTFGTISGFYDQQVSFKEQEQLRRHLIESLAYDQRNQF